jgi:L-methionine (R)-S-oxide reductase
MFTERRSHLRHKVNGPVFASFDGVTGGMILDLSEQGLSMQTTAPLKPDERLHLRLDLPDPEAQLETTGYIAWADALGRAGVRFADLPQPARQRLDHWLALNDESRSRKAPKLTFDRMPAPLAASAALGNEPNKRRSISLEAETGEAEADIDKSASPSPLSTTIQYEFNSLSTDLNSALRVISERARILLRGSGAAIALIDFGSLLSRNALREGMTGRATTSGVMMCRASVGTGGPPLGTPVDVNSGFSGECVRTGKTLRCDDAETDSRVTAAACRRLGIRSIAAAPIRYEREVVGLVEVFSSESFAFDEGDLAVLERLAHTALLTISQSHLNPAKRRSLT